MNLYHFYEYIDDNFNMSPAAVSTSSLLTSPSRSHHHLVLRLSIALVMAVTLLAGPGEAIDLMKLLDQKQQRSIKRAGKFYPF